MDYIPRIYIDCYKAEAEENGWTETIKGLLAYVDQRDKGLRHKWMKRGLTV